MLFSPSNFLVNMTGNSRQAVILPCEMVQYVLVNAAANHIQRSDRRAPKIQVLSLMNEDSIYIIRRNLVQAQPYGFGSCLLR